MTLDETTEKARISALNKYFHRCNCDFDTEKGCNEHEAAMAVLIAKLEEAEELATLNFKEPKRTKKEV